ncbi:MAG TPA: BBE domain-containing protein, partial [Devosia sp.]
VMPAPPLPFLPAEMVGQRIFLATMAYAGPAADAEVALRPFRALAKPYADLVGPVPLSALFLPEDPNACPSVSIRTLFTDRVDLDLAKTLLGELDKAEAPIHMLQVRVLGGAMARVPEDATAFAHRKAGVLLAYLALFEDPTETAKHDAWAQNALDKVRQPDDRAYVNFLAAEGARVSAAYPPATLARLQRIKRRYDPENLFRLNQNILPA